MVRPQNRPVPGQIIKVVHDDSHKQVDDLKKANQSTGASPVVEQMGLDPSKSLLITRVMTHLKPISLREAKKLSFWRTLVLQMVLVLVNS